MKLIHLSTNQERKGVIEKVGSSELTQLQNNSSFVFDWSLEKDQEVYKIRFHDDTKVLGLISLMDIPKELRVHIQLLEASQENVGKNKEVRNIPGCLIAFACRLAYERGYDGFVSLTPKTQLIKYYMDTYGFVPMGKQLVVFLTSSKHLINKYLDNG